MQKQTVFPLSTLPPRQAWDRSKLTAPKHEEKAPSSLFKNPGKLTKLMNFEIYQLAMVHFLYLSLFIWREKSIRKKEVRLAFLNLS